MLASTRKKSDRTVHADPSCLVYPGLHLQGKMSLLEGAEVDRDGHAGVSSPQKPCKLRLVRILA